ncbi:MAG: efflux RND transporter periplasmic adaptor subunit [Terriglobia bacterium]
MRKLKRLLRGGFNRQIALALLALSTVAIMGGCGATGGRPLAAASSTTGAAPVPVIDTAKVVSHRLDVTIPLPGELLPYEVVAIYPKVTGFVQWMGVDRGSEVKQGQLLARLVAPELVAQRAEAQAKLQSAENREIAAEAKLAADEGTYQRLKVAAATPGVISDEELEVAEKSAEADRASVVALRDATQAAQAAVRAVETLEGYLRVTAPFDGIITERNVHPGALVGPAGGTQKSMLRIEHMTRLRLVVAVPEAYVAGVTQGAKVDFTVSAFPGRTFTGSVARIADSLDQSTRTMPVELDVWNPDRKLHSGMFPQVSWPVHRPAPSLFVPQTAVARTMEAMFVIRVRDGKTEWVDVKPGANSGNLIEVFGALHAGDEVALHASEELRPNTQVVARSSSPQVAHNLGAP